MVAGVANLEPSTGEQGPQDELRRLGWGLLVYAALLLAIGIGVLRLSVNHRRFGGLTVVHLPPAQDTVAPGGVGADSAPVVPVADDSADAPETAESLPGAVPVSGATP